MCLQREGEGEGSRQLSGRKRGVGNFGEGGKVMGQIK